MSTINASVLPEAAAAVETEQTQKPGSHYVLPRDEKEAARLDLQYEVVKRAFSGRTLFSPYVPNSSYFLLDSGTGSGSWIKDVSSLLPQSAILHGFDINDKMFPSDHPRNVSFSINTMTKLPEEWTGKFDIVNQRFLIAALKQAEWIDAVANLARVLRPGGWIELMEPVMWRAGPVTAEHVRLVQALFDLRDFDLVIHEKLPLLLQEEGFVDIKVEYRQVPLGKWNGQVGEDGRDAFMGTFRGMRVPILRAEGLGIVDSAEELDGLLNNMEAEWDATEGAELTMCVVYAQKAQKDAV